MTSEGNSTISDSVIITLEARQDHRWDIVLHSSLGNVEGSTFEISPGDSFIVEINATNIGNLDDDISASGLGIINHQGVTQILIGRSLEIMHLQFQLTVPPHCIWW